MDDSVIRVVSIHGTDLVLRACARPVLTSASQVSDVSFLQFTRGVWANLDFPVSPPHSIKQTWRPICQIVIFPVSTRSQECLDAVFQVIAIFRQPIHRYIKRTSDLSEMRPAARIVEQH